MSRSRTPNKRTSNNETSAQGTPIKEETPAVINETHPEFKNMVDEHLSSIERNESHCENTNIAPFLQPLYSKYHNTPGYEEVIKEANRIYRYNEHQFNKKTADNSSCVTSGGSRKKRGTRQNKKRRGHKSQRHKSQRHKIYR